MYCSVDPKAGPVYASSPLAVDAPAPSMIPVVNSVAIVHVAASRERDRVSAVSTLIYLLELVAKDVPRSFGSRGEQKSDAHAGPLGAL